MQAAVDRFDVLINNAGNLFTGYFEEISPAQMLRTAPRIESMNGRQPGDPAKHARALLTIADQDNPLQRFVAGADAIEAAEAKARELLAKTEASRDLGDSRAYDDAHA